MNRLPATVLTVLLSTGCAAVAQTTLPSPAPGTATAPSDVSTDTVLDWLNAVGRDLKDFTADVRLLTIDNDLGNTIGRTGQVFYRAAPGGRDAKIRVAFTEREEGPRVYDERIEYVLSGGYLTERNYDSKVQVKRQVLKPGEQIDLLKLGEGPFPLPIGQDKADVAKMFDVTLVPSLKDDPADTIRLALKPKQDSEYARKFAELGVAVDRRSHMPRRIDAVDANGSTTRTTFLDHVKLNAGLADDTFTLEDVQGWRDETKAYRE